MRHKRKKSLYPFMCCLAFLAIIYLPTAGIAATEILNIRYWAAPDHTRIVIDLGGEPSYEVKEDGNLLIISLSNSAVGSILPSEIPVNKPGIRKIVLHPADDAVKVELILDKYLRTQIFPLKKFQEKPDRLVIDIFLEQVLRKETVKEKVKQRKTIVIDPGHGGDDPGAVGRKGTYEKDIVLAISREIKKAVNKIPGYRAVLTRDGDYYVSFNKRLQMAKDLNASLFISVHADAARNRQAKGSSIYCLSTGAASSEAAKLLAKNENLSDIIGGVPNGEGKTESDQIILNMFQTNTINLSKTYAGCLMPHLEKINGLKYRTVQEAPFRVLKLPDIPAVLIETAYISNKEEERLLKSNNFQKKLALAVSSSVMAYLSGIASIAPINNGMERKEKNIYPDEQRSGEQTNDQKKPIIENYKVKKGDTLFSIARFYNTDVETLLRLNDQKVEQNLFVGQKIAVPVKNDTQNNNAGGVAAAGNISNGDKEMYRIYIVKKGDTFFSLAKNSAVSVNELRKINNMKDSDNLILGQRIKLPQR